MTETFTVNRHQLKKLQNIKKSLFASVVLGTILSIFIVDYTEAPMPYTKSPNFKIPTYHFAELVANKDANHKTGDKFSFYKK
jgi:hypothetical protein